MTGTAADTWQEANKRSLLAAIAEVRAALETFVRARTDGAAEAAGAQRAQAADTATIAPPSPATSASALETLCAAFGLSGFERRILLMCAGAELDAGLANLYAALRADGGPAQPTFGLALAAFPEAHWSALSPDAPLRYWHLIELSGDSLTTGLLRIDERILHYLVGVACTDEMLRDAARPLPAPEVVAASHMRVVEQIIAAWSGAAATRPIVALRGIEATGKRNVAAAATGLLGLRLHAISAATLAQRAGELDKLLRRWEREAILAPAALLIECDGAGETEGPAGHALAYAMDKARTPLIVCSDAARACAHRSVVAFDVAKPTASEQVAAWHSALGPSYADADGELATLVAQFDLDLMTIDAAAGQIQASPSAPSGGNGHDAVPVAHLWDACRLQARPRLDGLAQRIEPAACWDDLILPAQQKEVLEALAVQVRRRATVYDEWGFAAKGTRGLGISALFAGPSGTGKTMAAEVLANDLRLDLYRIDLSQVVSKYIGETEKNLRRVFDAAESGAAVLLFDEADALFGKRTEIKDSHDRYANIEVSYLLQRMEAYRGLAILTTNRKSALDQAFLRRIRFVIEFPFPDAPQRAEIWRRVFPSRTPTQELNIERLAQLNAAGGHIRNIAMGAAFLAAEADAPVRMDHLLQATRLEFAKLEKPLTGAEIAGWT